MGVKHLKRKILLIFVMLIITGLGTFIGYRLGYTNNPSLNYMIKHDYSTFIDKTSIISDGKTAEKIAEILLSERGLKGEQPLITTYDKENEVWIIDGKENEDSPDKVYSVLIYTDGTIRMVKRKK